MQVRNSYNVLRYLRIFSTPQCFQVSSRVPQSSSVHSLQGTPLQRLHSMSRISVRHFSVKLQNMSPPEMQLANKLLKNLPGTTEVRVTDISGGCGAMYQVEIAAEEFRELRLLQQHQLVKEALKEEIPSMHGLTITTRIPTKSSAK